MTVMLAFASRIISFAGSAAAGIACGTVCSLLPAGQFGGPRKQSGSRVRQPEYQLHIFWIVWVMLYVCVHTSVKLSTTCAAIPSCQASLVPAMQPIQVLLSIRGHSSIAMRDDSDLQWRFFRSHLPLLLPAALLFVGVRRLITYLSGLVHGSKPSTAGTLLAYVILNLSVLVALFGMKGAIAMVAIAAGNYVLCLRMQQRQNTTAAVAMTWIYGLLVLFVNEWGVPEPLGTYFNEVVAIVSSSSLASNVLPHWDGLIPRWWVYWGPTMLRCVAFNHDWLWARQAWARKEEKTGLVDAKGGEKNFDAAAGGSSDARGDSVRNENHSASKWEFIPGTSARSLVPYSYDWRDRAHPPLHCFGLTAYFAYCFYAPALLAGPITSFSAFISHVYMPQRSHSSGALLQYGARLAFCLVVLELLSCCIPAFAVSSHLGEPAAAANLGPLDLTLFAYIMLKLIWLKFTIIWRFFRLWALLDGVELPENMARCMSNNFTLAGFWQGWHCSFNQWCVRYLYIPLGGRKHRIRNVFVTFTFVALWHDVRIIKPFSSQTLAPPPCFDGST
eukprot:SAG31_NODE_1491_length_8133_cov_8.084267_9_plen_558_part_00